MASNPIRKLAGAVGQLLTEASVSPAEREVKLEADLNIATLAYQHCLEDNELAYLEQAEDLGDRTAATGHALDIGTKVLQNAQNRLAAHRKVQAHRGQESAVRAKSAAWDRAESNAAEYVAAVGRYAVSVQAAGRDRQAVLDAAQAAYASMPNPKRQAADYRLGVGEIRALLDLELQRAGLVTNQFGSTIDSLVTLAAASADAAACVKLARGTA